MVVLSAKGHILELRGRASGDESLLKGMVGVNFSWKAPTKRDKSKHAIYILMKKYFPLADEVIGATDNDEEGELIFHNLVKHFKPKCTISRMLYISMSSRALLDSYHNRGEIRENIAKASDLRSWMDKVYGYAFSKFLTISYQTAVKTEDYQPFPVGRVMTPAMSYIVEGIEANTQAKMEAKDKEPELVIDFEMIIDSPSDEYGGVKLYVDEDQFDISLEEAIRLREKYAEITGTITRVEKKKNERKANPSGLMIDDIREWAYGQGLDYPHTDSILQVLYDQAIISYPRSESTTLPAEADYHAEILPNCLKYLGLEELEDFVVRDVPLMGEESDGAHYGVHPTGIIPDDLPTDYKMVYEYIVQNYVRGFGRDKIVWNYEYDVEFLLPAPFKHRLSIDFENILVEIKKNNPSEKIQDLLIKRGYEEWEAGLFDSIRRLKEADDLFYLIQNCEFSSDYIGYKDHKKETVIFWETIEDYGYEIAENSSYKNYEMDEDEEKLLPRIAVGDIIKTRPEISKRLRLPEIPDLPTKQDLFSWMREKNLGTDATRSGIIQKLWNGNLIRGDPPFVTVLGMKMYNAVKDINEMLTKVELTKEFEEMMLRVQEGTEKAEDIKERVRSDMREIIQERISDMEEIGNKLAFFGVCQDCGARMRLIGFKKGDQTVFFLGCAQKCGYTASI